MNDFLNQNTVLPGAPVDAAWKMDALHQSLPHHAASAEPWAAEFDPGLQSPTHQQPMQAGPGFSAGEFANFSHPAEQQAASQTQAPSMYRPMGGMGMGGMGFAMGMMRPYSPMMQQQAPQPVQNQTMDKGKGRLVELDDHEWEAQFASLEAGDREVDAQATDAEAEKAIEQELSNMDRSVPQELDEDYTETDHFGDFESIWRGIQAETKAARELAEQELFEAGITEADIDMNPWAEFDGLNTHGADTPLLGDYMFEEVNPFMTDRSAGDPFAEGVEIMDSGGNLSLAALAFESAVQKNPAHVDAWVRLGAAQAQNEKEVPSIRALEQALSYDPNNLEALMALAVSYTNEGYEATAYRTLERWVSVKYPQVILEPLTNPEHQIGVTPRIELHKKVTDMFIRAAQISPEGSTMDPDVQVGLGVLFYAADEFDKAIDCFEAALASTVAGTVNSEQNLHLLWNRLGATLANSGRSEEAIHAYERALELRPNFVRARYNLGVSCINMGVLPEAAGHLLGALEMHRVDELEGRQKAREIVEGAGTGTGPDGAVNEQELERLLTQNQSTNLYDTLRRVFTNMGRRDLTEKVVPGMDPRQFRGEFDF
jgi:peroxin-5